MRIVSAKVNWIENTKTNNAEIEVDRNRNSKTKNANGQVLHIFWSPYRSKCPGDQILIGHRVLWLWTVQEKLEVHMTDNQSWNSCCKVASDREFTLGLAIEPTKKKHTVLWPCTIPGHLLQPKHGASVVCLPWSTHLSFVLNWGLNFVVK